MQAIQKLGILTRYTDRITYQFFYRNELLHSQSTIPVLQEINQLYSQVQLSQIGSVYIRTVASCCAYRIFQMLSYTLDKATPTNSLSIRFNESCMSKVCVFNFQ